MQPLHALASVRRVCRLKVAIPAGSRRALLAAGGATLAVLAGFLSLSWLGEGVTPGATIVDVSMPAKAVLIASASDPAPAAVPPAPAARDGRTQPVSRPAAGDQAGTIVVAAVTPAALAGLTFPPPRDGSGLAPAPDPGVVEEQHGRDLPRIGSDGRKPWQVYARPFEDKNDRPRLTIAVVGLGLSQAVTDAAIDRLPGAITLVLDPYGTGLAAVAARARSAGHEVLLALPMESADAPFEDQGSYGLSTALRPEQNLQRLHYLLGSLPGYVGMIGVGGSRYAASADRIRPVLSDLKARGLLYMEGTPEVRPVTMRTAADVGLERVGVDVAIPAGSSGDAIDGRLRQLESMARDRGFGVGLLQAEPVALRQLQRWVAQLDPQQFTLAPVSAVVAGHGQP